MEFEESKKKKKKKNRECFSFRLFAVLHIFVIGAYKLVVLHIFVIGAYKLVYLLPWLILSGSRILKVDTVDSC